MLNKTKFFYLAFTISLFNIAYSGDNGFINFGECTDCGEIFCKELGCHECTEEKNDPENNDFDDDDQADN